MKFKYIPVLTLSVMFLFGFSVSKAGAASDLNNNSIDDNIETEVIVNSNQSLEAGEYFFNNLIITNNATLTLQGDPNSNSVFKGVKINAINITIENSALISADRQGYYPLSGPGTPPPELYTSGASYGGTGWNGGIYGSAKYPKDLGSGSPYNGRGGGAIWLVVSGNFLNDGMVTADGGGSASGGSVLIETNNFFGTGNLTAKGGSYSSSSVYIGQAGGGRIAIYYDFSTFSGTASASGGCGSLGIGYPYSCAGSGTVGFFDLTNNNLHTGLSWRFQANDSPFNLNFIYASSSKLESESGASVSAPNFNLNNSSFTISGNPTFTLTNIFLDNNSILTLSGSETITSDNIVLTNSSNITVPPEIILSLTVKNLNIDGTSTVSADGKGYGYEQGPGAPQVYQSGASYGGVGAGNTITSTYGSATAPVDFGSGGSGYRPFGGGAIRLDITDTLLNDGVISANGNNTSSGGSIYVTAKNLAGIGTFTADGGSGYCPNICFLSGGGGRIAIYYDSSVFTGQVTALGGIFCYYGCAKAGADGTVVMEQSASPPPTPTCCSNVLFIPGLEASRLYKENFFGGEDRLWEPNAFNDINDLYLNSAGQSINQSIYTNDIIDKTLFFNVYKSFILTINNLVSLNIISDWKAYAYDWRQGIDDLIQNGTKYNNDQIFTLIGTLQSLANSSQSGKVTIIAHSNGGLLAKALIKKLEDMKLTGQNNLIDNIDKLILVASPQIGTPDAFSAILHGYKQSIPGGLMSESEARKLAQNMSSAYGLLPSQKYFEQSGIANLAIFASTSPQIYRTNYGSDINNYPEMHNFVLGLEGRTQPLETNLISPILGNSTLLTQAESLHNSIDNMSFPVGLTVINIAGWGKDTVAGITYTNNDIQPIFSFKGDQTVVTKSALYGSGIKYWLDLSNSKLNHKNILEDPQLLSFLDSLIDSQVSTPSLTDTEPVQLGNRLHLSVHSPVSIGVYNSQGNFTGKVCDDVTLICNIIEDIPGSTYFEFGEGKYVNLGQGNLQKAVLIGTDVGTFTFESQVVTPDGTSNISSFIDIPVTTQTQAEITINQTSGIPQLKLDVTGDGMTDFTLAPSAVFDPITYLQIMKTTIDSLDITSAKKKAFGSRIDNAIKLIQKGKIDKAKLRADKFKSVLEKVISKPDPKKPKPKKLSKTDAQLLLDMLNRLLDNIS